MKNKENRLKFLLRGDNYWHGIEKAQVNYRFRGIESE